MNILLANPPAADGGLYIREGRCNHEIGVWGALWPPLSLASCAAVLRLRGHRVRIADAPAAGMGRRAFLALLAQGRFDLVAWSPATPCAGDDLALFGEAKKIFPACRTAAFGTHVSALSRECLRESPALDFIVHNEPEHTLGDLADALARDGDASAVAGLSFRRGAKIESSPARPYIEDLSVLPAPAWDLVSPWTYRLPLRGDLLAMAATARGCAGRCSFCTAGHYYGKALRLRPVSAVVREMKDLVSRLSVGQFFFWADTFTADEGHVAELCEAIRREGLRIGFTANSRIDVDPGVFPKMADAGCWMAAFGVESAAQDILDSTGKGTRLAQAAAALAAARKAGVKTAAHFILGLPGETAKSMEATLALAKKLSPDFAQFYCAVPLPGSRLYVQANKNGWIAGKPFSRFRQDRAVMELPDLPAAAVTAFRRHAYREFYARPGAMLNVARQVRPRGLAGLVPAAARFLRWSG